MNTELLGTWSAATIDLYLYNGKFSPFTNPSSVGGSEGKLGGGADRVHRLKFLTQNRHFEKLFKFPPAMDIVFVDIVKGKFLSSI